MSKYDVFAKSVMGQANRSPQHTLTPQRKKIKTWRSPQVSSCEHAHTHTTHTYLQNRGCGTQAGSRPTLWDIDPRKMCIGEYRFIRYWFISKKKSYSTSLHQLSTQITGFSYVKLSLHIFSGP